MGSRNLTRTELYELVWSKPLVQLAKEFGISDVAVAKAVRRYQIPMPGRGYWAKVSAGESPPKAELPKLLPGQSDRTGIGTTIRSSEDSIKRPIFDTTLSDVRVEATKLVGKVPYLRDLHDPHPVILRMLDADKKRKEKYSASLYPSSFDEPYFDSPFERRRLRILNSLLVAATKIGYDCDIRHQRGNPYHFPISPPAGAKAQFALEALKAKERHGALRQYPTNKPASDPMELLIEWPWPQTEQTEVRTRWSDISNRKLEDHLTQILVELLVAAEASLRAFTTYWFEEEQRRAKEEADAKRRVREASEAAAIEAAKRQAQAEIDKLLRDSSLYRQAADIRAFVQAVTEKEIASPGVTSWKQWAMAKADAIDPILNGSFLART